MADAIDNASCVVIFVSRAYKESANCRLEANYAHSCAKDGLKLLYVMCEEDYTTVSSERITGWLGLLIGQELWYPAWKDPADAAHKVAQKLGVSTSQSQTAEERVLRGGGAGNPHLPARWLNHRHPETAYLPLTAADSTRSIGGNVIQVKTSIYCTAVTYSPATM